MQGTRVIRSRFPFFGVLANTLVESMYIRPTRNASLIFLPSFGTCLDIKLPLVPFSSFSSSGIKNPDDQLVPRLAENARCTDENNIDDGSDDESEEGVEDDDICIGKCNVVNDEGLLRDIKTVMDLLRGCGSNRVEMKDKLDQCNVKPSPELVVEVLSRVRNDWETAFTFFVWVGNQPGYICSIREYHSMISILGKMRKFDTAWALIDEMRKSNPSLLTPQTLLIMIRKYCAVHDVGRAINTFYAYKRFKLNVGIDEFQSLLSALCRYKNVQDAEHLMFCNKDVYPINIKSFNIILNGWCNIIGSPREAERVWREMGRRGVRHDVVSYGSMLSCYSKSGNLHKVLRLFDQMKKTRIEPDRKVYNAVVHALAKARFATEAVNLMKTMEEKGLEPNIVTYNSLIKPLCKARKIDEARRVFDEMLTRGILPTIRTYHAFMRILRTGEEVFELLEKMRKTDCEPTSDTYVMLIRKFCRWRDFDNVLKLWTEINERGVGPDRSSYIVMIHGLFLNGKVEEAYRYYLEMKEKGLVPEPNVEQMIQSWVSGKQDAEQRMRDLKAKETDSKEVGKNRRVVSGRFDEETNFLLQPQTRKVVRERGFSFWDD